MRLFCSHFLPQITHLLRFRDCFPCFSFVLRNCDNFLSLQIAIAFMQRFCLFTRNRRAACTLSPLCVSVAHVAVAHFLCAPFLRSQPISQRFLFRSAFPLNSFRVQPIGSAFTLYTYRSCTIFFSIRRLYRRSVHSTGASMHSRSPLVWPEFSLSSMEIIINFAIDYANERSLSQGTGQPAKHSDSTRSHHFHIQPKRNRLNEMEQKQKTNGIAIENESHCGDWQRCGELSAGSHVDRDRR